jgi:hypothetical protein
MSKLPTDWTQAVIDVAMGKALRKTYGNVTRRSFLSGTTRKLLSLAGVGIAAQVFPFFAKDAKAQFGTGATCGLHGPICVSGTPCSGGVPRLSWKACCQIPISAPPCPTVYICCNYVDYCLLAPASPPANWPIGCAGPPPSGVSWCGGVGTYVCTSFSCGASYQSWGDCANYCMPTASFC